MTLARWVASQGSLARVRPDMRIVVADDFEKLADRLDGTLGIMREIAKIAGRRGRDCLTDEFSVTTKIVTTWDENKRLGNLAKHGVDFRDLEGLDWREALIFEDRRKDYGETRLIAMAPIGARLHVVVFVERGGERRIISARKANSREVEFYENQTHSSDRW